MGSKKSGRCSRIAEGEVSESVGDMNLVRYINDVNDLETCESMLECGCQVMCTCV